MNLEGLKLRAGSAETLLEAMASQPRLMMACELMSAERSVAALQHAVGLSMSAMSRHLARPRADALVSTRRESRTLIATLHELYRSPVDATKPSIAKPRRSS